MKARGIVAALWLAGCCSLWSCSDDTAGSGAVEAKKDAESVPADAAQDSGAADSMTVDVGGSEDVGNVAVDAPKDTEKPDLSAFSCQSDSDCSGGSWCKTGVCMRRWATSVVASRDFTCARLGDGRAACWGTNTDGQLGTGNKLQAASPRLVAGLSGVREVGAGSYHGCASGAHHGLRCWGRNSSGQVTGKSGSDVLSPVLVANGIARRPSLPRGGYQHTCTVSFSGDTVCWGSRTYAQTGGRNMPTAPHRVPDSRDTTDLSVANVFSCRVAADKSAHCWGSNSNGQLGRGTVMHHDHLGPVLKLEKPVKQIAAGSRHACALHHDGTLSCWGQGVYGQLGQGDNKQLSLPVAVTPIADVVQVSASPYHTCARRKDGTVWCWGLNSWGQLGDGTTTTQRWPVQVTGLGDAIDVSAGFWHTCAVRRDGEVVCWGKNEQGALGTGAAGKEAVTAPVEVVKGQALPELCDVAGDCGTDPCRPGACVAGFCAVATDLATGENDGKACPLDGPDCGLSATCKAGTCAWKDDCDDGNACTAAECGVGGICANVSRAGACADEQPCTWGSWCAGKVCKLAAQVCDDGNPCTTDACANGTCEHKALADGAACDDDEPCTAEDVCKSGTCVGKAVSCGENACQVGVGCVEPAIKKTSWASQLAAGADFTCAVGDDGAARCWGRNDHGQTGTGPVGGVVTVATLLAGHATATTIAAGEHFGCATNQAGRVRCWGRGDGGQLGLGKTEPARGQALGIEGLVGARGLALGKRHGCALAGGRAWCWGSNDAQQLGHEEPGISGPKLANGVPGLRQLAAGGTTNCGIDEQQRVLCWGGCDHGQCGDGNASKAAGPTYVRGLGEALAGEAGEQVAVGDGFACAVTKHKEAWCWGRGNVGQVGAGAFGGSRLPRRVRLTHVASIVAGRAHGCDGGPADKPACWGHNLYGKLGKGDTISRAWAVAITGAGNVIATAAGGDHTCWARLDGSVRCAGTNSDGRLGNGKKAAVQWTPSTVKPPAPAKLPATCTQDLDCDDSAACVTAARCVGGGCDPSWKNCDDGNPCTADTCDAKGQCAHNKLTGPICSDGNACDLEQCQGGKCTLKSDIGCKELAAISGTIAFDWILSQASYEGGIKLNYDKTKVRPSRRVVVQAIAPKPQTHVLAETVTDDKGKFSLALKKGTKARIRALAWTRGHFATLPGCDEHSTWDIRIVDNAANKAQWAIESPVISAPKVNVHLHAKTTFDSKTGKYTERQSGPFSMIDTAQDVVRLLCTGTAVPTWLPTLQINWGPNNVPESGLKSKGQIGTASHYTNERGLPVIYLKGAADWNTDEYDDHIVAHEIGHHVENMLFRSDSIGGKHSGYEMADPRLAFGEGYANALSVMALRDPVYVNVSGKGQVGGFEIRLADLPSGDDRGVLSERSVAWLLIRLWEQRKPGYMTGTFERIRAVLLADHGPSDALTSLLLFGVSYRSRFPDEVKSLLALFKGPLDTPLPADRWDQANVLGHWHAAHRSYPNGSENHADPGFWQLYRELKPGKNAPTGHDQVRIGGYSYAHNKFGASRWYRLRGTGKSVTVAVTDLKGAKCTENVLDLRVYRQGDVIRFNTAKTGPQAGCPKVTFPTVKGLWYVLDARSTSTNKKDLSSWAMLVE